MERDSSQVSAFTIRGPERMLHVNHICKPRSEDIKSGAYLF